MYLDVRKDGLRENCRFSFDIGGSCAKIAYIDQTPAEKEDHIRIKFKTFLRDDLDGIVKFLTSVFPPESRDGSHVDIRAAGFGSVKHKAVLETRLNVKIHIQSEFDGFVNSTLYLLGHYPVSELFSPMADGVLDDVQGFLDAFRDTPFITLGDEAETTNDAPKRKLAQNLNIRQHTENAEYFPCLMCMFGSGNAFYLIDKDGKFNLLDGTGYGGRWLMCVSKLILGTDKFEEFVRLAAKGDFTKVDICGSHQKAAVSDQGDVDMYDAFPDDKTMFAFGQIADCIGDIDKFQKEDIAASLLQTYCFMQAQSVESAARSNKLKRVVFAGGFISNEFTAKILEKAIAIRLHLGAPQDIEYGFLTNGGYYGALGLLLK